MVGFLNPKSNKDYHDDGDDDFDDDDDDDDDDDAPPPRVSGGKLDRTAFVG